MEILSDEDYPSMGQFNELSQSVDDIQKEVNELDRIVIVSHESAIVDMLDVLLNEESISDSGKELLLTIKNTFYGEPKS